MSPTPLLAPHTLRDLAARYRTGTPLSCAPVTYGLLNRGYRVAATGGTFFLKHHLDADPADPAPLERRHRAIASLEAAGLPAVPPVAARDGRTVSVVGGRCFALHPWVEGRHLDGLALTEAQSRRLGALLGTVHTRLQQVLPAQREAAAPEAASASADPAATHALIDGLLTRVHRRGRRRDGFDELAEYRLRERRRLLHRYADARPAAVPAVGWVHGDFHPLNLIYGAARPRGHRRGGEPLAIVDWDRLAVQPRAEEAVRGAAIFFLRPDGSLDLRKVPAYARAYRYASTAPQAELGAAVHRVWWERLNDFWMLRWRYERHDSRPDPQFAAASALVVWWTRRYAAVHAAFCD
ncbi:aminoglycoside phosphotransferase [Streptomyces sp. RKND-216]|uniref:phosphotransferase n=1 Tax=Streptomyces sp. RKND-216 TaxID=2562581 RepID=UPI00109D87C1|nr:phosphotransferase [Streptomyces sp. RKND-216]THA25404.1 aminoglycoside phosphotransferase [Streptomyces sp. RKND-216]